MGETVDAVPDEARRSTVRATSKPSLRRSRAPAAWGLAAAVGIVPCFSYVYGGEAEEECRVRYSVREGEDLLKPEVVVGSVDKETKAKAY